MSGKGKKETKKAIKKQETAQALSPYEEMEQLFDRYFSGGWLHPFQWRGPALGDLPMPFSGKVPRVDIIDHGDEILVKAEVPGVDKKDLEVSASENSVSIKGSTSHEEKEEKADYYRCEMSSGSFSRLVPLPANVDADKASTKFKDGILELTLPKAKQAKRHTVKID